MIPFKEPSIGPSNEDKQDTFTEFECLISSGVMSSMVGWAIQQGKAVTDQEGRDEVVAIKDTLRGVYSGRSCQNWALLLFFGWLIKSGWSKIVLLHI